MTPRTAVWALWLVGCAPTAAALTSVESCPLGTHADEKRLARLHQLLAHDPAAATLTREQQVTVCFGDLPGRGTITNAVVVLPAPAEDAALAPRLAHLLIHHRDSLGTGCTAGLPAALRSESEATALEARLRQQFHLSPDDPKTSELTAAADYNRRCSAP